MMIDCCLLAKTLQEIAKQHTTKAINLRNPGKTTQMEHFSTSNIFYEEIGNIAVFMVDFIRAYCRDFFV